MMGRRERMLWTIGGVASALEAYYTLQDPPEQKKVYLGEALMPLASLSKERGKEFAELVARWEGTEAIDEELEKLARDITIFFLSILREECGAKGL